MTTTATRATVWTVKRVAWSPLAARSDYEAGIRTVALFIPACKTAASRTLPRLPLTDVSNVAVKKTRT